MPIFGPIIYSCGKTKSTEIITLVPHSRSVIQNIYLHDCMIIVIDNNYYRVLLTNSAATRASKVTREDLVD